MFSESFFIILAENHFISREGVPQLKHFYFFIQLNSARSGKLNASARCSRHI